MKYFLDTEFMERPGTIELISIGIVAEDGREFYAENAYANFDNANDFVKENVIPHLWVKADTNLWSHHEIKGGLLSPDRIAQEIRLFVEPDTKPQFWGYYADYDWVVFCWLFGTMMDLPRNWPMYCRDIKQWVDMLGGYQLPGQSSTQHHALEDARWNKEAWHYLKRFVESKRVARG